MAKIHIAMLFRDDKLKVKYPWKNRGPLKAAVTPACVMAYIAHPPFFDYG
jgi:hypothetical protein